MPEDEAAALARADLLWRTVQSMLRITVGRGAAVLPAAAAEALLRAVGRMEGVGPGLGLAALDATLDDAARTVRAIFDQRIGTIA